MTLTNRPEGAAPVLAFSQGDPSGIGPELIVKLLATGGSSDQGSFCGALVVERAAVEALLTSPAFQEGLRTNDLDVAQIESIRWFKRNDQEKALEELRAGSGPFVFVDPVAESAGRPAAGERSSPEQSSPERLSPQQRTVVPGEPTLADAKGAIAALDLASEWAREGEVDALVTLPLNKKQIAESGLEGFVGHTDYLASRAGLTCYGHDYLMAFLAPQLRVALLSTHVSLRTALDGLNADSVMSALRCLATHGGVGLAGPPRIALAGLNPHAGEGGLLGSEDEEILRPVVEQLRTEGLEIFGPESPDTVFHRATQGEFDWVLALYHDQGLIAVKSLAFGSATNWTLGLPYLRTSVDHGTAYDIAGQGIADPGSLLAVIRETLRLLS